MGPQWWKNQFEARWSRDKFDPHISDRHQQIWHLGRKGEEKETGRNEEPLNND